MTSLSSILEIDPSILRNNIQKLKNKIKPSSNFLAVIKSDAYGHILSKVVHDIDDLVDGYGVVRIDEAIELRKISKKKILLMQGVYSNDDFKIAKKNNLDLVVHNQHQFNIIKINNDYKDLWFKINTGMNRLGFEEDDFLNIYENYLRDVRFTLMTHLAASNIKEDPSNKKQFLRFEELSKKLNPDVQKSIANTGCILNFPEKSFDWVRVGIGIFGGYIGNNELQTAITLKSPIINVKEIATGERVGYDGRAVAKNDMKIATVYLGYADGLPQHVKDGSIVMVNNQEAKVFGKVSMDVTTIDVTNIQDCSIGDWCEYFSPNHSINNLASNNGSISYDLMIRIKSRVKRIYKNIN
ncbi:alanine racemase [Gammaproteobacteria bacterium]|jgi:alanine racemase|nr:alanine racemase [Gammaproteobacteria bacterium]MDA9570824.1 alanine racemase [Gammaproteobacteria bacterium]MDA9575324.1 alanine racemase [Gammaproteobacteria bacterium]MDA9759502.1 alanine racemase [Gammaproteobacteria bacterium]MDA9921490.1 alanine racemase [Gammaproteobacteria bacterium]